MKNLTSAHASGQKFFFVSGETIITLTSDTDTKYGKTYLKVKLYIGIRERPHIIVGFRS